MNEHYHPQIRSFLSLFPEPGSVISIKCELSKQLNKLWNCHFSKIPLSYLGLSAKSPSYDHNQAEIAGNDYTCKLYAHFNAPDQPKSNLSVFLGDIPYPDENGEFVLRGNRYYMPMILCPESRLKKFRNFIDGGARNNTNDTTEEKNAEQKINERQTDSLHVLLLDELLNPRLSRKIDWIIKTLIDRSWNGDLNKLRRFLRQWLHEGKSSILHKFIYRHGKLVNQENPISRISQRNEMSFYYPRIVHPENTREFDLRDVDDDDLYRICPVQTPQGHKVGLRLYLARRASIDLDLRRIIGPNKPQPADSLGNGASLIPFIENDDVSRALMGTNMMQQTLPLTEPEAPLIQTGWEKTLGQSNDVSDSFKAGEMLAIGKNLFAAYIPWGLETFEDGIVISKSASEALTSKHEKVFWFEQNKSQWLEGDFKPIKIGMDNPRLSQKQKLYLDETGIIKVGSKLNPGDILVSAYMTAYKSVNKTKMIDLLAAEDFVAELLAKSSDEIRDVSLRLPHNFKGKVIKVIDSHENQDMPLPSDLKRRIGIVVRHDEQVKVGDKIASRHGAKGVVVKILADSEMPYLKSAKSYCTDADCPARGPHRHIQVILNPLGVTGRLNVGQLFETALAKIAEYENKPIIVKPFEKHWSPTLLSEELVSKGFTEDGKEQLYINDGDIETALRYRSFAGPQYFLRLHHLAEDKSQGRGRGRPYDYSLRDNQPNKGKRLRGNQIIGSGQRVGEMETWALAGHAAWNLLDDLLTIKSDDNRLRKITDGDGIVLDEYRRPQALVNLILILKSLGLDLRLKNQSGNDVTQKFIASPTGELFSEVTLSFTKPDQNDDWLIGGQISSLNMYDNLNGKDDLEKILPHPEGLLSRIIFDPRKPWQMGQIPLARSIEHPLTEHLKSKLDMRDYMLDHLAVLPVYFRHERLGFSKDFQDDLNVHYRNILQINKQLKTVLEDQKAESDLCDVLEKKLRYAVGNLFSGGYLFGKYRRGILDIIKGKKGLVRGHLSGKRSDYSGRAVIVCDPNLPLDEASIPENLWQKILPGANKNEKPVALLNRQPSLHRYSFQAFRLLCHRRDNVIRLNPFVCKPFNADFDGDTIAIHVPRKSEAKIEADKLLPSRNLLSQANGKMVLGFDKDIALAAAYITYHPVINTDEEVPFVGDDLVSLNGDDLWDEFTVQGVKTTVGRLLLRKAFGNVPISNQCMDKEKWSNNLEKLAKQTTKKEPDIIVQFTNEISELFSETLRKSGLSLSFSDFSELTQYEHYLDKYPRFLWLLRQSGKYDKDLETQIAIKRGPMRRPGKGDDLTEAIESCLVDGHSEKDYLVSAHGARAGLVDKGLITAHSGHLLRDLIYRLQKIYIVKNDCKSTEGIMANRFEENQLVKIRFDADGALIEKIHADNFFRSPLTCNATNSEGHRGICQKCYGIDPSTGNPPEIGLPVGILAAQAIGERVSQETLKSFHTGGIEQTQRKGLALVNYLRGMLSPKNKATDSEIEKLIEIYKQFSGSSQRPSLVHFEVILFGYKLKKDANAFLSDLAKSQAPKKLVKIAIEGGKDDLFSPVSRLVSGRIINSGPKGANDA